MTKRFGRIGAVVAAIAAIALRSVRISGIGFPVGERLSLSAPRWESICRHYPGMPLDTARSSGRKWLHQCPP